MPRPYTAVGLIPTVWGIRTRSEIQKNLDHITHLIKAASWLSSLDLPVRLIAIPEGALQAFNDEVLDLDHVTFARECAIDIPGPETRFLGDLAKEWKAFSCSPAGPYHRVPSVSTRFSPTASTIGFFPACCALSGFNVCGRLSVFSRYALFN